MTAGVKGGWPMYDFRGDIYDRLISVAPDLFSATTRLADLCRAKDKAIYDLLTDIKDMKAERDNDEHHRIQE